MWTRADTARVLEELPALRLRLELLQGCVDSVDACLDALPEELREVAEETFPVCDNETSMRMCERLNISNATLFRWRIRVLDMLTELFEKKAVKIE